MAASYDDVFYDILLKLPSKSLLRFKSLSKKWSSVISDSKFCRSHLERTRQDQNHRNFVIYSELHPIATLKINDTATDLEARQIQCPLNRNPIPDDPRRLESVRHVPYFINSIVHCDGLLCVAPSLYREYESGADTKFVVWNPLTMQHKIFPQPKLEKLWHPSSHWESIGLGYDSVVDDYKIVHVMSRGGRLPPEVRTLRLKLGSWESGHIDVPYLFSIRRQSNGIYVKGYIYWICREVDTVDDVSVLCFDLHERRMREETSLSTVSGRLNHRSELGLIKETLYLAKDSIIHTDIWIMIRRKFWVKILRLPSAYVYLEHHFPVKPLLVTENGLVLSVDRREDGKDELTLCDPGKTDGSKPEIVSFHGVKFDSGRFSVIPYVESIVSP